MGLHTCWVQSASKVCFGLLIAMSVAVRSAHAAEKEPPKSVISPAGSKQGDKGAADQPLAGTFQGQVLLVGKAPNGVAADHFLVNPETKGICNVFIYLRKSPPDFKGDVPKVPVTFEQNGFRFVPHAFTVRSGQTIGFVNRDPKYSSLQFISFRNVHVDLVAPPLVPGAKPPQITFNFPKSERMPIEVRSNEVPELKGYMLILDHPFMAATDKDGKFSIPNLPPGKHDFLMWHESVGLIRHELSVTISAGKVETLPIKLTEADFKQQKTSKK